MKIMKQIVSRIKKHGLYPILLLSIFSVLYCILIINGKLSLMLYTPLILLAFGIVSLIGLIFPIKIAHNRFLKYLVSPVIYSLTTASIIFIFLYSNNSPTLFSSGVVHGYSEICICFRKNGTYKIDYQHLVGGPTYKYGKYTKNDTLILLNNPVIMGRFMVRDSMTIEGIYLKNAFANKNGEYIYRPTQIHENCKEIGKGG